MEIKELEIDLNIEGWDYSGGRSYNVWGLVDIKNLPFKIIEESIANNKKSCIWTCYDDILYINDANGNLLPIDYSKLPSTISATFKPTYQKYTAVVENLAMKIAVLLDIPTSYNYIVKFDIDKHPKIKQHLSLRYDKKTVKPYGIVSIDFLKSNVKDNMPNGEELLLFEDTLRLNKTRSSNQAHNTSIDKWIKSVDDIALQILPSLTGNERKRIIDKVNSRIVKSFLFREFLGDCDYTELNSGLVINKAENNLQYAPNFDYGECFNSLIQTKFVSLPDDKILTEILKWDKDYIKRKLDKKESTLVESLAQREANVKSKQNMQFVAKNYTKDMDEFLKPLIKATKNEAFNNLIDEYVKKGLLNEEESKMFKIYLNTRAGWLQYNLSAMKENCKQF